MNRPRKLRAEPVVTGVGLAPPNGKKVPAGLAGRDFAAAFASDLPTKTISFSIGGNAAAVTLRPMDAEALTTYYALTSSEDGGDPAARVEAIVAANAHLVGHTLLDATLWQQAPGEAGAGGTWQQVKLPAGMRGEAVAHWVETTLAATAPEFWEGLLIECVTLNFLAEGQLKNSPAP